MSNTDSKLEFYSLNAILNTGSQYNMIIGERSNGKTYACLEYALKKWINDKEQTAYIRRWKEDYRGKRGQQLFAAHAENELIEELTDGKWTDVYYYSGKWYLSKYDEELEKSVRQKEPFCFAFSLNDMEHDKSIAFPQVTTIIFDEFLTRQYYLPNEFVLFMNVLSTIIRHRNNVKIFMLGNTVNKYCPYFKEMGLRHITEMEQGTIDVYNYGDSKLKVAVEYCKQMSKKTKASDIYFAFDNPSLQMITGGVWEIDMYPHVPCKFSKNDIMFIFFIQFDDTLLQCEVVSVLDSQFLYIHEKTTPIQNPDEDIIFTDQYSMKPNYYRNIRKPYDEISRRIANLFRSEKVFYQDNEVGEVVHNYLQYCISN